MVAGDRLKRSSSPRESLPDRVDGSVLGKENDSSDVYEVEQEQEQERKEEKMKKGISTMLGLAVALVMLMLAVSCGSPNAGPSILTDKPDYAPEETVTISGAGFTPGSVVLTVTRPDGRIEQVLDVSADSSGSFTATYQLDGIVGTYVVNAADSAGKTAQTTFTDGSTGIGVGSQVGTLTYGTPGSVNYTVTVYGSGGGGTKLFTEGLPSGTTASFNPSSVGSPWPATSTLTISYGGTTPTGTYTFCVGESPSGKPPAAHSVCTTLKINGACADYWHDVDGDGYGGGSSECRTSPPAYQYATVGGDCDDSDEDTYPGAPEICDGKDNDCDGALPIEENDSDGDGTPDCNDNCPNDPSKTEPGICGCGTPDTDSDGDGTADCSDQCPNDPNKIVPGQCGCSVADTDSDGDDTADCNDQCPNDPNKIVPGQCGCGTPDTDSDGDGVADCNDQCPNDPNKIVPGQCGCGTPDTDSDGDGVADCNDDCPADPGKTEPGICGCGVADLDSDSDGVADCKDGCPADPNKTAPGVCGCGVPDTDTDGDGEADCRDLCPSDPDKVAPGICGCGVADTDSDGDGVVDCNDGCPADPNKTDPGVCGCGVADADADGDGSPDCVDGCPSDPNKTAPGACGCGVADTDWDDDGVPDCNDGCPGDPGKTKPGVCGCGVADTDTDGDGTADCEDQCPNDSNKIVPGQCGCGVADTDSDGDGVAGCLDCNDSDDTIYPGAPEIIDSKDNDCDGSIDEDYTPVTGPLLWILLTHSGSGGTVTDPGEGVYLHDPDAVVNLAATPDAGYHFAGWTGGPDIIADVSTAATTVTMNRDCAIKANFAEIPPETPEIVLYDLTTSSTSGGSVSVPGEGTFTYNASRVLDLVAKADSGYKFVNWTGDVTTIANVNGATTTITMNGDYSIVANFEKIPPGKVTLTVSSTDGGSVTAPGERTFAYDEGTVVNLEAEPEEGYSFVKWIGDVDDVADVTAASTTITMNDNYSITATFKFGTGCFIATAAYGTPMAEEIQILREFRDGYLLTNPVGKTLVELYYRLSPPIAEFITEHPSLKPIVRAGLIPAVAMSTIAVNTTPAEKAAMVGLLVLLSVALAIWATRRRGKSPQYV